ncbi:MAG TPA: XdhC family protein [Methylomirabilota bacterium]
MTGDLFELALALRQAGEAFALATVVRCERPTSAKPGAKAIIRADGTLVGWIGGACAEPVVVREALAALRDGQPRFLGLVGDTGEGPGRTEGMLSYAMSCHSGGTLEVYVEPYLPKPRLVLIGHGPVVETLATLGHAIDFDVSVVTAAAALEPSLFTSRTAVVVATHGNFDEDALARALASGAGYVSLVASRKRAAAVVESLRGSGLSPDRIGRLKAPAGLDIGAVSPAEIAVSILAEIVQARAGDKPTAPAPELPTEATDPVCGMLVEISSARYRSQTPSGTVYFCCRRCQELFDAEPARYST